MTVLSENTSSSASGSSIRVMVVDDSAVIRGFLSRFIESDPSLKVVSSVANGQLALDSLKRAAVDIVLLDIEMPVMDGMTALPLILKADPYVQVIMASTLTKENAAITMRALQMGASECLAKPMAQELAGANTFRDDLVKKVKTLGMLAKNKRAGTSTTAVSGPAARGVTSPVPLAPKKEFTLRSEMIKMTPDVIAVGSSTGGPQALLQFFSELGSSGIRQPVFITQHMPPTFTTILAEHIAKQSGLNCKEAAEGDIVQEGHVYLAPGNYHMLIKNKDGKKVIELSSEPPENFCRPAVDPMLRSLIAAYGKKILAVILTGMGADGQKACQQLVEAGGVVIAQDEASSVVWGMPGAVAMAGLCTKVLPLNSMAAAVKEYAGRGGAS